MSQNAPSVFDTEIQLFALGTRPHVPCIIHDTFSRHASVPCPPLYENVERLCISAHSRLFRQTPLCTNPPQVFAKDMRMSVITSKTAGNNSAEIP